MALAISKLAEVSFVCENLFEEEYDIASFDIIEAPGRKLMVELNFKFQ